MNENTLCVLDFETNSTDPYTCQVFQIASVMVHPQKLEIIEDSLFNSFIRPEGIENRAEFYNKNAEVLKWHANNFQCTVDEFLNKLEEAPSEKFVFKSFTEYLKSYHKSSKTKTQFSAPIFCGFNSINFDKPILNRLADKYKSVDNKGVPKIFNQRLHIDIMILAWLWLKDETVIENLKMDHLRDTFSLSSDRAHDAAKDVYDEASLLIRFLKLHRAFAKNVTWQK